MEHPWVIFLQTLRENNFSRTIFFLFSGFLNSLVHILMYGYYFMSSYNPRMPGLLWWKNLITKTQLLQFACLFVYFIVSVFVIDCKTSKFYGWMGLIQSIVMIAMFGDFYIKAYLKKKTV